jgi:hypothetical protein
VVPQKGVASHELTKGVIRSRQNVRFTQVYAAFGIPCLQSKRYRQEFSTLAYTELIWYRPFHIEETL